MTDAADLTWTNAVLHLTYATNLLCVPPTEPSARRLLASSLVLLADQSELPYDPDGKTTTALLLLATDAFPGLLDDLRLAQTIAIDGGDPNASQGSSRVARMARAMRAEAAGSRDHSQTTTSPENQ